MSDEWRDPMLGLIPAKTPPVDSTGARITQPGEKHDGDFETFLAETCDDVYGDLVEEKQMRDGKRTR